MTRLSWTFVNLHNIFQKITKLIQRIFHTIIKLIQKIVRGEDSYEKPKGFELFSGRAGLLNIGDRSGLIQQKDGYLYNIQGMKIHTHQLRIDESPFANREQNQHNFEKVSYPYDWSVLTTLKLIKI